MKLPIKSLQDSNRYPIRLALNCVVSCGFGSFLGSTYQRNNLFVGRANLRSVDKHSENLGGKNGHLAVNFELVRDLLKHGIVLAAMSILLLRNAWPKTLQVLLVFRYQGLILAALFGLSAFFSMAETSITTLWPCKKMKIGRAFQGNSCQHRSNLAMISCGWFTRLILYANYLVILFTAILWIKPLSEMLVNKNTGDGKDVHLVNKVGHLERLFGSVGIVPSNFAKFRIWSLLLLGFLQLVALRPNLQMYWNKALCLGTRGLSQLDGNSVEDYQLGCGLLPCSTFLKEVALFLACNGVCMRTGIWNINGICITFKGNACCHDSERGWRRTMEQSYEKIPWDIKEARASMLNADNGTCHLKQLELAYLWDFLNLNGGSVDLRAALLKKCAAQSEQMEEDHLDDAVIMWRNLRFKLWIFQMIQQFPICSCRSRNANKIDSRWRIQGGLEVIDLGNGYYLVKLPTWEDRSRVLSEGLWVIVGHYLSGQSWKPEFNPLTDRIHHMALWKINAFHSLEGTTNMNEKEETVQPASEEALDLPLSEALF
ncbi:hypothetical protein FEM48_Zijuj01G0247200 [Ziziphus jujuba var. spinosa]|uniref:DUF4283 domain-containing protein n=1 Tax=Ziziphus jujuba var. spinosa TaxID=714518 RepID=A0A978W4J0_ZIZJJ|nr:hypothetical protein FEM48_Zijuj01G0247200 [Ziziphus jujuba var. spinosa]